MSRAGKFLFLFSFLFFLILCVTRIIYGGWQSGMWGPFLLCIILFVLGCIKDARGIREIAGMRTTKHGMNMGAAIALVIAVLTCVNIFGVRYEKRWDWTSDRLNSLSDQSVKAVQSLRGETRLLLLYRKGQTGEDNISRSLADLAQMYQNVAVKSAAKLKYEASNALQRPDLAQEYDFQQGAYAVFLIQGNRKVKIETPNEEGLTRALLKIGRDKKKTFYFTMGHGERVLDDKTEAGLSRFKEDLDVIYDVKPLVLFQAGNKVPDDADVVAIIRPNQQFLESELQAMRDYAKRGGHLLLAIDPGTNQNLAQLTKTFGVEYANNFILDLRSQVVQGGPAMVLGTKFSATSDITKAFNQPRTFIVANVASELKIDRNKSEDLKVEPIVSSENTMSIPKQVERVSFAPNGPHILGVSVEGKLTGGKDFSSVIFGDSDFFVERLHRFES